MEKWSLSDIKTRNNFILFFNAKQKIDCLLQSRNADFDGYWCVLMFLNLQHHKGLRWIGSNLMARYLRTYSGLYTLGTVRTLPTFRELGRKEKASGGADHAGARSYLKIHDSLGFVWMIQGFDDARWIALGRTGSGDCAPGVSEIALELFG